jgi:membrane fusion protein, multidrug efflux system
MNLEQPNTVDRHPGQETMPGFASNQTGEPRSHGWLWLVILVIAAAGVFYYFHQRSNASSGTENAVQGAGVKGGRNSVAIPVVLASARKGDIGVYFTGLGAVTPIYTVTIKSQISGYLMQVLYREGQIVQKGDLLAEIDPRPYQVMLEQAQAGLARDQANLENANVDLKRYQTLVPLKAIPEQQLATQQALVKSDAAVVQTDQAQIDTAKLDLTYCHITAPITGRVGLRLVDPGNYVTANDSTGLVVITQIQPISVIFTLPEDQLPAVLAQTRAGARLKVEAYDREMANKIGEGALSTMDNQIDPTTGTVKLRATFDNSKGSLFPNQFVNARLLVLEKKGVVLVPTATVQRNAQQTYVYLVVPPTPPKSDLTVTVRSITIGTTEGDDTEITSGLNPGDQVVMTGVDKLQEGSPIKAPKPGERRKKGSS